VRLLISLPSSGVLAVQMPDNTNEPALALMREATEHGPYAGLPTLEHATRGDLPTPGGYYDLLRPLARHLDVWHIVYNHVMAGPEAIGEWFKGLALRPFLDALDEMARRAFLSDCTAGSPRPIQPDTMARSCFDSVRESTSGPRRRSTSILGPKQR